MPRMKNAKKQTSPYKKVSTLERFGFVSPDSKHETAKSSGMFCYHQWRCFSADKVHAGREVVA